MTNSGDWVKALVLGLLLSASVSALSQQHSQRATRTVSRPATGQKHADAPTAQRSSPANIHQVAEADGALDVDSPIPDSIDAAPNAAAPSEPGPQSERAQPTLRRLKQAEVTRSVVLQARRIIKEHHQDPFGTEIPFTAGGQSYVARIERHYHPPGGDKLPWGEHAGASVFVAR